MDPWPWGSRPATQRPPPENLHETAMKYVSSVQKKNRAKGSSRVSVTSSEDSVPALSYRSSAVMGSNQSPASVFGHPYTPARAQLQNLITQERKKIEQSQEHIVALKQAMDLLDMNSED